MRVGKEKKTEKKKNTSRAMHSIPKDVAECKCVSCNIDLQEC